MQEKANRAFEKLFESRTTNKLEKARIVGRGEDENVAKVPMKNIDQYEYQQVWREEDEEQGLLMSCPKNVWYHEAVLNAIKHCEALDRTLQAGLALKPHLQW